MGSTTNNYLYPCLILLLLCGCARLPPERSLTLFVEARELDYTSAQTLAGSLQGQRRTTDGTFGHAWLRLEGPEGTWEGGHTGELGRVQPKYFDGVARRVRQGHPNPISYLWEDQWDGYVERGSGRRRPTHKAVIPLTKEQFDEIANFLREGHYQTGRYNLTNHQCATFVAEVAALAGVHLRHQITVPVEPTLAIDDETYPLWTDPRYSRITLSTPDVLAENAPFSPLR